MALKRTTYTLPSKFQVILQRVGVRGGRGEARPVRGSVATSSADLGGSSKYSSENLEGRSGERFRENSS